MKRSTPAKKQLSKTGSATSTDPSLAQHGRDEQFRLGDKEQLFRILFERAPVGFVMTDAATGRVFLANERMATLVGYGPDQLLSFTLHQLTHPDDQVAAAEVYARLLTGAERQCTIEQRYVRNDGQVIWAKVTSSLIQPADTLPIWVLSAIEDITERRLAIQALRESEQRFRVITDASPIMVWMAGTDKLCYYFSKGWLEFVGRTLEQEAGNGWAENVHPDDFDRCLRIYVTNFDERRAFEMHYRLRHHTGQYRWILDHGVPRYAPDGTFEGYVGGCLDIHDQIEAAEKVRIAGENLRRNKDVLEVALAASETGTFRLEPATGEFLEFDDSLKRLIGVAADPPIRTLRDFLDHVHAEDLDAVTRAFENCRDGSNLDLEYRVVLPEGGVRWLYDRAKIERDADGVVKYLIGACTNITARKQAEDALRSSEKLAAAGRLAATVAHEINNPLASVVNLLYLVARDPSLSERSRHNLKLADEELDRVSYFARQTLGFYRDNTPATWLDTSQVINELIHIYSYKIRNRNVALETDVSENLHVFASGAEFRQVFSNLLINAVDALPGDGGRVRVRARHVRDWRNRDRSGVRLTVADSGCGIDTANLAKIFEAFYTTKQEIGTGLGLWLCKNIVDKHHGTIRARSRMSGGSHGTVLTVFWPDEAHGASTGASGRASTMHSPAA